MIRLVAALAPFLAQDVRSTVRRARRNAILWAVAAVFGLTAYVALIAAIAIRIAATQGAVASCLLIALAALVVTFAVIVGAGIVDRRDRRDPAEGNRRMMAMTTAAILPSIVRSRPLTIAAGLAGLAFIATWSLGGRIKDEG